MNKNLELFDKKLLVLYILDISKKKLSIDQIVSFTDEFDDITYFDIYEYVQNLKQKEYIKEYTDNNITLYSITENGLLVLSELLELIPGVDLYNLKKILSKNAKSMKQEYTIGTDLTPIKSNEFKISCYIKDGNDELVNISIYAGNKENAKTISKNWNMSADEIYKKILEMMTK